MEEQILQKYRKYKKVRLIAVFLSKHFYSVVGKNHNNIFWF